MAGADNPLLYLLAKENASSIGIAGERLQKALDALFAYEAAHPGGGPDLARLEKAAVDRLYSYIVQREAGGLFLHDGVLRDYRVPRRLVNRMGAS